MRASTRYQSIDALRGLAALMVMFLHVGYFFSRMPGVKGDGDALINFFQQVDIGRIGITIFFIISGFVIPKSIRLNKRCPGTKFVIKRFFRLYPLFWLSIILGLGAIWYLHHRPISLSLVLANVSMIPAFFSEPFIIGLYWTLETELIFYVFMVILVSVGMLRHLPLYIFLTVGLYIVLFLFVLFPAVRPSLPHWTATPYHLSLMFLGVLFRHHYDLDLLNWQWQRWVFNSSRLFYLQFILVLSVPLAVLVQFLLLGDRENLPDGMAYLLGIAIFFVGLSHWKKPPRLAIYLGMISYSIYLLHPVVFSFLQYIAEEKSWFRDLNLAVYSAISVLLTIALCHFSYALIEKPFNRFGHRKAERLDDQSTNGPG